METKNSTKSTSPSIGRIIRDTIISDHPWASTVGGGINKCTARFGELFENTQVEIIGEKWHAYRVRVFGWVYSDSLTINFADVATPRTCEQLQIDSRTDSTTFIGNIKLKSSWLELGCCLDYRLLIYDDNFNCIESIPFKVRCSERGKFKIAVPYPRSGFTIFRFETKGYGIMGLYK